MLVITRKRNETIVIGDGIEVTVLRLGRDTVRIGITAPSIVPVHRREVYDQIRAANAAAAGDADTLAAVAARLQRHVASGPPSADPVGREPGEDES